jgi:hypothetical protein
MHGCVGSACHAYTECKLKLAEGPACSQPARQPAMSLAGIAGNMMLPVAAGRIQVCNSLSPLRQQLLTNTLVGKACLRQGSAVMHVRLK